MSDLAIRVENLGKMYRIGARRQRSNTLRERLQNLVVSPFDYLRSSLRGPSEEETLWALRDVSFKVKHGQVIGVIGRNGAGKSTLLKVLSRITEPTEGRADIYGRMGSLLEVGTGFHPELTGRENTYLNGAILGMKKTQVDRKFDEIVDFSGVEKFIDMPVKRYSSGMKVRLAFSVAAHLEPEILLVDEVLAVGDAAFQKKCLGKMGDISQQGRTVMFVSHNMKTVLYLCPSSFVLDGGRIAYHGRSEEAIQFYLRPFSDQEFASDTHVLYQSHPELTAPNVAEIFLIEVLDDSYEPKPFTHTWDDLIIRIHYVSRKDIPNGTFVFDFFDRKQQRLIVLDSGTRIPIESGKHHVDCYIPRMPLAAGDYTVGAGLTISRSPWLWREQDLGTMRIHGKDVFSLGRPPEWKRMCFALEHGWRR